MLCFKMATFMRLKKKFLHKPKFCTCISIRCTFLIRLAFHLTNVYIGMFKKKEKKDNYKKHVLNIFLTPPKMNK